MSKDVTLSSGQVVKVYAASAFAMAAAVATVPLPETPMVEVEVATAGGSHSETQPAPAESPAYQSYLLALKAAQAAQNTISNDAWFLLGLRDVRPPEGWRHPEVLTLLGIQPREGEKGRRLDYIFYDLLENGQDLATVSQAVSEQSYSRETVAKQLEDSFRPQRDDQRPALATSGSSASADANAKGSA